ncbi:MAG TPA: maltotransferase domain-containing protein, partial [Elusimicrobiota bacterium]|nr:maltotransferase domain-containing protein [Elusimicrobiota bacterium]
MEQAAGWTSGFGSEGALASLDGSRPSTERRQRLRQPPTGPEWRQRVVIEDIQPQISGGRFPIKRCTDETVVVRASVHADGTDRIAADLRYRAAGEVHWTEQPMLVVEPGIDLWESQFEVSILGR